MASMRVWYDQEGDFLEVTFEEVAATLEEVDEDIFERRTPEGRVVGFAVMNFSKHNLGALTWPLEVKALPAA